MKERQHGDHAVVLPFILAEAVVSDLADVRDEVSVREHHPLGQSRGAAGIRERDEIDGGLDGGLGRLASRAQQRGERRRAAGLAVDEALLHAGPLGRGGRPLQQRRHRDQQTGAAVLELGRELLHGHQRVGGRVHPTDRRDRVEGDRIFGQIRSVMREHVALAEASVGEARGHPTHGLRQLCIGDRPTARGVNQSGLVSERARTSENKVGKGRVRNFDIRIRAADHGQSSSLDGLAESTPAPGTAIKIVPIQGT